MWGWVGGVGEGGGAWKIQETRSLSEVFLL